jgi:hypothetical protein
MSGNTYAPPVIPRSRPFHNAASLSYSERLDVEDVARRLAEARGAVFGLRAPLRSNAAGAAILYCSIKDCLKTLKEGMKMQALNIETRSSSLAGADTKIGNPGYQAYRILQVGFTVAPIVAGLDKFFGLLVNWDQYLPSFVNNMVGGHGHSMMYLVGVIEIIAGLGVWFKPRIFAYVVAAWLFLIIANLLMIPGYFDVALRDLGLALGALALGRLSQQYSD